MAHAFDRGPVDEPFASLVADYPGDDVYPSAEFRVEWGPIFHRGRLDGTARLLVVGQDPAASEAIARRILVGEAGHRLQGLVRKLGFTHSYVLVNTYLYSVYGQKSGEKHIGDGKIADYRNRWFAAVLESSPIEAVLSLGHLADSAWQAFLKTPEGKSAPKAYRHVTHPTQPDAAGKDDAQKAAATKVMLANWNDAVAALRPAIKHPDVQGAAPPYGDAFRPDERLEIPEGDLPAGLPAWMRSAAPWAKRTGADAAAERLQITVTIPS